MLEIKLPENCSCDNLLETFNAAGIYLNEWHKLIIKIPYTCFVECPAMVYLTTWGLGQLSMGKEIKFVGSPVTTRYLSRMNFYSNLGIPYEENFKRHTSAGRFFPISLVSNERDCYTIVNNICDLVLHLFDNSRALIPSLEWAVNEIIGNVILHSESTMPGAVVAQYYDKRQRLEIAVFDFGRGIKSSLEERTTYRTHEHAVKDALKRGVTRNTEIGQGNGLAGAKEVLEKNSGDFCVWTGDTTYRILNGCEKGFYRTPFIKGTGVRLSLNINSPVDLSDTFIGASSCDFISCECERIAEQGGLFIKDECIYTGIREPAKRLRNKILAMLPDMEGPLILNFYGINSATSSFLDELLGRLALKLGIDAFIEKIKIVNAPEDLINMANVVIKQRLHGIPAASISSKVTKWLRW